MTDISRPDLIKKLGINSDTLHQWQLEGLPIKSKGRGRNGYTYDLDDVMQWIKDNNKAAGEDFQSAKTRKEIALASIAELELKQLEGELVRVDELTDEFHKQLLNVKQRLLAMPAKLSGPLLGIDDIKIIHKMIEDEIYTALNEISHK